MLKSLLFAPPLAKKRVAEGKDDDQVDDSQPITTIVPVKFEPSSEDESCGGEQSGGLQGELSGGLQAGGSSSSSTTTPSKQQKIGRKRKMGVAAMSVGGEREAVFNIKRETEEHLEATGEEEGGDDGEELFSSYNDEAVEYSLENIIQKSHSSQHRGMEMQEMEESYEYDDGWSYVQLMTGFTEDEGILRQEARDQNSVPREDCPICGDRVNGIHYGIYTCEGCKNFFKRSMTIKKRYICNLTGNCDINIVIDNSGIKRKGARCQACRFKACIAAGMVHQGYNRSRNQSRGTKKWPHNWTPPPSTSRKNSKQQLGNSNTNSISSRQGSYSNQGNESPGEDNTHDRLFAITHHISERDYSPGGHDPAGNDSSTDLLRIPDSHQQLVEETNSLSEDIHQAELDYERNKSRELERSLEAKTDQVKMLEAQVENLRKHMTMSQTIVTSQQQEIVRLKREIEQLGLFKHIVNKAVKNNSGGSSENGISLNGDE